MSTNESPERPKYLSEQEAERLSLSEFVRAARRTLEEKYERISYFETNPPASDILRLTPADRAYLHGLNIKVDEEPEAI